MVDLYIYAMSSSNHGNAPVHQHAGAGVCVFSPPSPSLKVQHVRILIEIINKLNDFDLKTFMYCVVRDVY